MSTAIFHKNVSSLEAILSSIETDDQVYQWFTFLALQSAIREHVSKHEPAPQLYTTLKKTNFFLHASYCLLLMLIFVILFSKQFLFLLGGLVFIYPLYKLHLKKKKCVVEISRILLTHDFEPTELCQKTLYQLGEIYSRKYNIPSLVDTIYALDNGSRKAIIFAFVFTAFIYPLKVWQIFLSMFLAYLITQAIIKTSFVYKQLK